MNHESRVRKSLLNARVNLVFYFIFVILSFFSRKTFLECLGAEFMGLSGTLINILGFLSLAEMGVGTAVAYNLYKPLQQGNKERIEELVSVFGYLYNRIGLFILLGAGIVSCFIPLIFKHTEFSFGLIYFAFFSILIAQLFSYFINYRQIILTADQKGYLVTGYLQGAQFCKIVLQMAIAYYWGNYYAWIALEVVFGFVGCIVLNRKIDQVYPWLKASVKKGKKFFPQNKQIITYTKQVFVHKIKDFLLSQSDQILVFAFVSLKMVAYYGNYTLVVSRLAAAFDSALNSFSAGVGNLVAEGNKEKSMSVFWEIVAVRFLFGGFVVFSVFNLIEPFISLWLGSKYILDREILILLMITIFITQTRGAVDMFNGAHGLYSDTWAAWAEAILFLAVTLALAPKYGIVGILAGKIVSQLLIIVIWKPIFLFRKGFKEPISKYWKRISIYYLLAIVGIVGATILCRPIVNSAFGGIVNWCVSALEITLPFAVFYIAVLYFFAPGAKPLFVRLYKIVRKQ